MDSENGDGPTPKKLKTESPTPQPIPQLNTQQTASIAKTNRAVHEIVDGSDFRKFLNKHFTEELISGLKHVWDTREKDDLEEGEALQRLGQRLIERGKQKMENKN
ncbi:hypothetical protein OGAPHI_000999 [Ogataea philodendri]|uniref:Uncharacterized protein n=1 Tax=Ogataea philodendri TaxID=1378263 RepID=A0A9P8PFV5_9ASCO|nr:uncharacterized protein OGAPHI_000999 [Ogataea philodendri]KAH3670484.1 hypothetical protein OGAPHI_000999 [Ogataea philodendri]